MFLDGANDLVEEGKLMMQERERGRKLTSGSVVFSKQEVVGLSQVEELAFAACKDFFPLVAGGKEAYMW